MTRLRTMAAIVITPWLLISCSGVPTSDDADVAGMRDSAAVTGENVANHSADTAEKDAAPAYAVRDFYSRHSYSERRGRRIFTAYCDVCHGGGGQGDGFNAFNLDPRPRDLSETAFQKAISDQALTEVVSQGGRGSNKSVLMPAYGQTLSEQDVADVVAFIRKLAMPDTTTGELVEQQTRF